MPRKATRIVSANDLAIAKVAKTPVEVQTEWKVDQVQGLSLVMKPARVDERGNKEPGVATYYARVMAGEGARRKQVRQAIGRANGPRAIKLSEAKKLVRDILQNGPTLHGGAGEGAVTLRQLFGQFEQNDKKRAPRTMADYRDALERDIFKTLGDVPVSEITAKDVAKELTKIETRSRNAAHKTRAALGSLYKWATKRFLVDTNVMIGMGFTHKNEARERKLTDDEIGRLWCAIESAEFGATLAMRLILKLAMLTGQRNSEVAGAHRSELHIDASVANANWHIPGRRMKRKDRDQYVFLSKQARELFVQALELAGDSEFVFPATTHGRHVEDEEREHITQESVSKAWARASQIAAVENVHLHDMRKAITSWLGDRGERSDVLDRILHHHTGHHTGQRSSTTDTHYNFAIMSGPLRDAWQRWADHVTALATRTDHTGKIAVLKRA
jgi:integrase